MNALIGKIPSNHPKLGEILETIKINTDLISGKSAGISEQFQRIISSIKIESVYDDENKDVDANCYYINSVFGSLTKETLAKMGYANIKTHDERYSILKIMFGERALTQHDPDIGLAIVDYINATYGNLPPVKPGKKQEIFPHDDKINGFSAKISGFLQKRRERRYKPYEEIRRQRKEDEELKDDRKEELENKQVIAKLDRECQRVSSEIPESKDVPRIATSIERSRNFVSNIVNICQHFKALGKEGIEALLDDRQKQEIGDNKDKKEEPKKSRMTSYPISGATKEWVAGDIHGDLNSLLTALIGSGVATFAEGEDSFAIYDTVTKKKVNQYPKDLTDAQF